MRQASVAARPLLRQRWPERLQRMEKKDLHAPCGDTRVDGEACVAEGYVAHACAVVGECALAPAPPRAAALAKRWCSPGLRSGLVTVATRRGRQRGPAGTSGDGWGLGSAFVTVAARQGSP